MNLDDQLPGLLAREAEHADVAPPTREGVEAVVGRRSVRRRRQRVGLGALAGLCLVAGVAGGIALSGDEEDRGFVDVPSPPGEVVAIGIDRPGWDLTEIDTDVGGADYMDWDSAVTTFHEVDPADIAPYISVSVLEYGPTVDVFFTGAEEDLGSGITGYVHDGSVSWVQANEDYAFIRALGVQQEDLVDYARRLTATPIDLETVPAPAGFPVRTHAEVWDDDATLARTTYHTPNGTLEIEVTDQPAWIETVLENEYLGPAEESRVAVAPGVLGGGTALLRELDELSPTMTLPGLQPPFQNALWRTSSGLQVRLTAYGPGAEGVVRDVLENGGLVLLDDAGEPLPSVETPGTPTSEPIATTTTAATITSIVDGISTVTGFTIEPNRITIEFEGPAPGVQILDVGGWDPRCEIADPSLSGSPAELFESVVSDAGASPWPFAGFVNVAVSGRTPPAIPGPVVGPDSIYLACDDGDGDNETSLLVFPMEEEPLSASQTVLPDPPRVVIEVQT